MGKRTDGYYWHQLLIRQGDYISPKILSCTSSLAQTNYCKDNYRAYSRGKYPADIDIPFQWQWQFCGYGINAAEMGGGFESNPTMLANGYPMLRQSHVKKPSNFIVCGESGYYLSETLVPTFRIENVLEPTRALLYPYHQNNTATNLLLGDGSCRTITGNQSAWYNIGPVLQYNVSGNMWTWNNSARWDRNAKR